MRLDTAREETITNLGGSQKFKMNPSAKAFQILSSGIYERKEEAIVRELGCNAYDSHVMAGKADVPFEVHLPTPIDPIFSVEDFGVGLSEDEVYNVYTTYFESTKTDSNDVIGALGLGSKTPFSYTDSFTIVARKDGKECQFSASIGQSGEPEVVKMFERPTLAGNGVKVSMEVNDRDIHKFTSCAEKVYGWFAVKPECNKSLVYDISDEVLDNISQYGYHLRSREGSFGVRGADCKVIMGNVAYDLDLADIKDYKDEEFNKFIDQLENVKADLYFSVPIGDADVAASRETLSLDERTVQNLQSYIRTIRDNFVQNTEDKAKGMRSIFEAYYTLTGYERSLIKDFDIGGYTLKDITTSETRFISCVISDKEYPTLAAIADKYDFTLYGDYGARNYKHRSKRGYTDHFDKLIEKQSDGSYLFPVVINDCERKMGIKDALMDNSSLPSRVLVVSDKNTSLTPDLEKLINHVTKGCYYIVYASSFWDGKLAVGKKSTGGLADEVVKARCITTSQRIIDYRKVDLSSEDKSRWVYADSATFGDALVCGKICSRSTLLTLLNELDLDGIILYNGNNERKVKRILGTNDLTTLVKAKANPHDVEIGYMQEFMDSQNDNSLLIFEGYEKMLKTIKDRKVKYYQCSRLVYRNTNSIDMLKPLEARIEVFKQAKRSLMNVDDMMLTTILKHGNFANENLVNQVKEYIKQRKEK